MNRECRIGSLPWFAGVWWMGVGCACQGIAWGLFYLRDGLLWAILGANDAASACFRRASECAREGGAE